MKEVTSIQITKELKDELKILVAERRLRNYNELIKLLLINKNENK